MSEGRSNVVAITGASGYLGGVIKERLQGAGWHTVDLVRTVKNSDSRQFDIASPVPADLLNDVEVLIHCAYDMSLRNRSDIWRVNVNGTHRLLQSAREHGVRRTIVLSSMSAFEGTEQIYGQAKLQIEEEARMLGACSVRPGVVYGRRAGGMAGTLSSLTRLPVVPLIAQRSRLFTVHEDDFAESVAALIAAAQVSLDPIGIANPVPVTIREILEHFARDQGHRCRFLPIDWRIVNVALRTAERLQIPLPVRADSLLGLVQPASDVPNLAKLELLGIRLRRFGQPVPPRKGNETGGWAGDEPV
jgi:nucleoside-diphosphate-sugar epimerase